MAIVKNPLSSEDARNRFGPVIVFSGWRTRKVVRVNVSPTNPNTSDQQDVRAVLSQLSKEWNALSYNNAMLWNAYASTRPFKGIFGEYTASGINWYVRLNWIRAYQGDVSVATPPTTPFKGDPDTFAGVGGASSGEVDLTWNNPTGSAAADYVRIDVSRQLSSVHEAEQDNMFRISTVLLGSATSHTVTGLAPSGYYGFRLTWYMTDGRKSVTLGAGAQATA